MIKLGLTGGIATGKSTVSGILRELGAVVLDADALVHELLEPEMSLWHLYCSHFGKDVLLPSGQLDRRRLGEIIFQDSRELAWIKQEVHPLIKAEILKRVAVFEQKQLSVLVLDIPLLYESGFAKITDIVWVVYAEREVQLQRLQKRNNFSQEEAKRRINSQIDLQQKCQLADKVIDNNGTLAETRRQTAFLWRELQGE